MLTGQPPFPEGSVAQRLMSHQVKSPTAIEKLRHGVPADLVTIVEQMIAKSPDDRYQTAREVSEAFSAWLAQHADDDWKEKHRDVVAGEAAYTRHEPTRARSAATEDTDVELGLAPTEDDDGPDTVVRSPQKEASTDVFADADKESEAELGLDQLEVLDPLETSPSTGSSSGGLDDLLSEALDNYPAFDSSPPLPASPLQSPAASGIQAAAKPTAGSESNQLFKLLVIGLAVSVPLAIVILIVSNRFLTSSPGTKTVASPGATAPATMSQPDVEPASEPPPTTASPTARQ